ncbi:MAG TPA: hypothetical protein VK585_06595 [Jiangellaceae bacterium]|nr:hypothetical protein [Jiangellaceae bacterium]
MTSSSPTLHWDHVQGLPFFRAGDTDAADVGLRLPAQHGASPHRPGSAATLLRRAMSPRTSRSRRMD